MTSRKWKKLGTFLLIAGGLNWGLIGLFGFNLVSALTGPFARIVYIAVGIAAVSKVGDNGV
ncbi:MAG: DUF378 domain-containing protein [Gemmatimonadota bacterium]|nr:DUF378 domain-containing protein [Gemmatimonadota bacterium]MDH3427733.1 DUF378 domain-containing protein [Gemmatimonadota bacterium]